MRLRSLSLRGPLKTGVDQLEIIYNSIPSLLRLTPWVIRSSTDIVGATSLGSYALNSANVWILHMSTYSQLFSKLENLLVLQLLIIWDVCHTCLCGHEDDPLVPHQEGTGMGRLGRRFTPECGPAVVRLVRKQWVTVEKACATYLNDRNKADEIRWIEHPADPSSNCDLALKKLEDVLGYRTEAEAKVFSTECWA